MRSLLLPISLVLLIFSNTGICEMLGQGLGRGSLLYNPGPTWKDGLAWGVSVWDYPDLLATNFTLTMNLDWGTDLSDALWVKNPQGLCPGGYQLRTIAPQIFPKDVAMNRYSDLGPAILVPAPGPVWGRAPVASDFVMNGWGPLIAAPGRNCATYLHDTRVGWRTEDYNKLPGWNIFQLDQGSVASWNPKLATTWSLGFAYLNDGVGLRGAHWGDPVCATHEVGLIHDGQFPTSNAFVPQLNGLPLRLSNFSILRASFEANILNYDPGPTGTPGCVDAPTAAVSVDFRFTFNTYPDGPNGKPVSKSGLIGVEIWKGTPDFNVAPPNLQGRNQPFHYKTDCPTDDYGNNVSDCTIELNNGAAALAIDDVVQKTYVDVTKGGYHSYAIDFKALVTRYFHLSDLQMQSAAVVGLDIYSEQRGANVDFVVRSVDLVGYWPWK